MVITAAEPFCFVYPDAGFEHTTPQQRGIRLRLFHRLRRDRVGGECRWHEPTLRRRDTSRREARQGRRGRVASRLPDEIKTLSNGSTAAERFAFVLFNALMGGGTEVPCSDKFYFRVQKRACHSSGKWDTNPRKAGRAKRVEKSVSGSWSSSRACSGAAASDLRQIRQRCRLYR